MRFMIISLVILRLGRGLAQERAGSHCISTAMLRYQSINYTGCSSTRSRVRGHVIHSTYGLSAICYQDDQQKTRVSKSEVVRSKTLSHLHRVVSDCGLPSIYQQVRRQRFFVVISAATRATSVSEFAPITQRRSGSRI